MAPRQKGQGARAALREMILSGHFMPGTYLPSVRELAAEIEMPKSTIHNILTMLQQEGLVQIQPKKRGVLVLDSQKRKKVLSRVFVRPSDYGHFGKSKESTKVLGGLCAAAERRYTEVLLSFSDSLKFIDEIIDLYHKDLIQGVIYMECGNLDLVKPLEHSNIPYVVMDDDPSGIDCVKCIQDFRNIARQAVYYLHKHGHKKIGMLHGDTSTYLYSEMMAGFRGALAEEGLECNQEWIIQTGHPSNNEKYSKEIIKILKSKNPPTAFFTARDYRAALLYEVCDHAGINIPEQLSVISYDDINWEEGPGKGLTTFSEPVYELGETAMDMLHEWVSSGEKPSNREVKSFLIERSSVKHI